MIISFHPQRNCRSGSNPSEAFRFLVEERIVCQQSQKAKYTQRVDYIVQLPVQMDQATNTGEALMGYNVQLNLQVYTWSAEWVVLIVVCSGHTEEQDYMQQVARRCWEIWKIKRWPQKIKIGNYIFQFNKKKVTGRYHYENNTVSNRYKCFCQTSSGSASCLFYVCIEKNPVFVHGSGSVNRQSGKQSGPYSATQHYSSCPIHDLCVR